MSRALKTLFFALYFIGDSKVARIDPFENYTTMTIGYTIYALFHIASITVLMSMLIAMMTKSYEKIIHHSDIEWKFARSKLYMTYINEGFTLPVPFNLIPTPLIAYISIRNFVNAYKEKSFLRSRSSISNQFEEMPSVYENKSQASVMPNTPGYKSSEFSFKNKKSTTNDIINEYKPQQQQQQQQQNQSNDVYNAENQKLTYGVGLVFIIYIST